VNAKVIDVALPRAAVVGLLKSVNVGLEVAGKRLPALMFGGVQLVVSQMYRKLNNGGDAVVLPIDDNLSILVQVAKLDPKPDVQATAAIAIINAVKAVNDSNAAMEVVLLS